MLAVLIVSSSSCSSIVPVRLELPNEPSYFSDISSQVISVRDQTNKVTHFTITLDGMMKLAKNRVMCREDNKILRQIIKTTH